MGVLQVVLHRWGRHSSSSVLGSGNGSSASLAGLGHYPGVARLLGRLRQAPRGCFHPSYPSEMGSGTSSQHRFLAGAMGAVLRHLLPH